MERLRKNATGRLGKVQKRLERETRIKLKIGNETDIGEDNINNIR